jgi:predicted lipoprotein with Yx(FWY)xxD motif
MGRRLALALLTVALPATLSAAPPPDHPALVSVGKTAAGPVYVDATRKTLYTMSIRWARARTGVGIEYCAAACLAAWTPLVAEADAKPLGDWTVLAGPKGPQWAYKGNPVFSFNADNQPGDIKGDGYDYLWSTLLYVPPKPELVAPPSVAATPVKGENILTDTGGRALFTATGTRAASFTPFAAAMASRPVGEWTVLRDSDVPQWAWRGKAVFVSREPVPTNVPADGEVLKP